MDRSVNLGKKLKSPGIDATANINIKTSVTCENVPEGLFDAATAKKHFSKFGRVQKIRLFPKKQMCIIEYDQPMSSERAVLNAGAFDGFMFDVTRTKPRVRRRSKREEDPDWVPDADVEEELSAMSGAPTYRITRQKPMEQDKQVPKLYSPIKRAVKRSPIRSKVIGSEKKMDTAVSGKDSPVTVMMTQTTMSTAEAAAELHQLRSRVSLTADEKWRTLDARDRILRVWGGAGSRVKIGGATIGTCPDMCPEKELLHRQAEYQVMTLETYPDSDGWLEPTRAIKQYSRSSADQEIPMCYELRPARVLTRTCAYLLREIADTKRQVTLADWFHFMWDRLRGIRKDITQQALCCAESICLVEMCARFHAHCAARLADLDHSQFDQKLNTDNLTKCLQTLKHMYSDVGLEQKPREAEFRGYIALLNLGDANFLWEINQLPDEIQKSEPIKFAIQIFNALDNNNYVRFFRLVKQRATYLQACILLRYFNDVRARGLARIVKAYAPRGGSRYPAYELMNSLIFESVESMKSFINHYGLRFSKDESELTVILDRNQFIEDMDPYPIARAVNLIESKRQHTVGEVIYGGQLPDYDFTSHILYSSFSIDGRLKEAALTAEDQGYNTVNDSNKNVQALKAEIQKLGQGVRGFGNAEKTAELKAGLFVKPATTTEGPGQPVNNSIVSDGNKLFSFKPAIPVAPTEIIKNSPDKIFKNNTNNVYSFSKPQDTGSNVFVATDTGNIFKNATISVFDSKSTKDAKSYKRITNENQDPFRNSNLFKQSQNSDIFKKQDSAKFAFGAPAEAKLEESNNNVFKSASQNAFVSKSIFGKANEIPLTKPDKTAKVEVSGNGNIFSKVSFETNAKHSTNIFGTFSKHFPDSNNLFTKPGSDDNVNKPNTFFTPNGDAAPSNLSPGTLFKSANNADGKGYSIFQTKNKSSSVAANIFNSINASKSTVYEFDQNGNEAENQLQIQRLNEEKIKEDMERKIEEQMRAEEEEKMKELQRQEDEKRKNEERQKEEERRRQDEERRKQEELKILEEKRKKEEERKQEELRKRLEEERRAEIKRKAEVEERKFKERVERESTDLIDELVNEVRDDTLRELLAEEIDKMKKLMYHAGVVTEEIWVELCDEMCESEMKAEKFWTEKLVKKWFYFWRKQFIRNFKRRNLLENTPVWLTDKTPLEEAADLRRVAENAALRNMNAFHRGYKFTGQLQQIPPPEPYNIMEIIKSPLLKRMKQINYPYDKCFFWKVTLVSPEKTKYLYRKIELEKWLLDAFSDNKKHEVSDSLINVEKQSWNNLMDFAISVSVANKDCKSNYSEAMEGTNGLLFYFTENDQDIIETIEEALTHKYPYQKLPVAIILPKTEATYSRVEKLLSEFVNNNTISCFRIYFLDTQNISESLSASTKSALKWLARKYPQSPPLETDYLKSICLRYLGNEIWYRLRSERDSRMSVILKDLLKLVSCYNAAVDKLTDSITNEDVFNYPSFPQEFKQYLDDSSPYPKPYEFIHTNARNSDNISTIKDMMRSLKLPYPLSEFDPVSVINMQDQIRKYCNQIGWFENPEEVVCKVVAILPNEFSNFDMPIEQFKNCYEHYDLVDVLNIIVCEKINRLNNFDNRYAVYEKSALHNYRNTNWLYETEVLSSMKHKALEYEDDLDMFIEAKRRRIAVDSMEYVKLEDNDCTMVKENIKSNEHSISLYSNCTEAMKQLEEQLDEERQKSIELENLLKTALSNVYV